MSTSSLEEKIMMALKEAMKAKDQSKMRALRAIKSAILLKKTDGSGAEMDSESEIILLQKLVKQRQDSLQVFEQQKREDLAQIEREEISAIMEFLPAQLSADELESYIREVIDRVGASGMKDMGKVMGVASKELAGRADGKAISGVVKQMLTP